MTATTPGRARSADQRAADVLTLLRGSRATLTGAEIAAGMSIAVKTLGGALSRLKEAGLIIAVPEMVPTGPGRPDVALWWYCAAADAEWPDWLPMPQESTPQPCHGPIGKPWLRGVPNSVFAFCGVTA